MTGRRERLLGAIAPAHCLGVEVGALASPIVSRSEGRVVFVDYTDTATLRAKRTDVDPLAMVEVDIVWAGPRSLREAVGEPADYVLASHVIEHVPDLIGWLLEIHALLKPAGTLGLAIPDRRFTFDLYRNDSTIAEAVEAYILAYRRPSLRQVFDSAALSRTSGDWPAWRAEHTASGMPPGVLGRLAEIFSWMKDLAVHPDYHDAHCWVFTPASFLAMVEGFVHMGCFPYVIDAFYPTAPNEIEFQVRLRATTQDDADVVPSVVAARRLLAGGECGAADLDARIRQLARENEDLRATLQAVRASRSWRLTQPLRSARQYMASAGTEALRRVLPHWGRSYRL